MGLNKLATSIPGRGTVFIGDEATPYPADWATMSLTAPVNGWDSIGHTSRSNTVKMTRAGGDASQKGSWWEPNLDTIYAPIQWGLTVNSLQLDKLTFDLGVGGIYDAEEGSYTATGSPNFPTKAVCVITVDHRGDRSLTYMSHASWTMSDGFDFNPEEYMEVALTASINTNPDNDHVWKHIRSSMKNTAPTLVDATATAVLTDGSVTDITLVTLGSGYTAAPTVEITGGDGTGATATATYANGRVSSITVTDGGTGYTSTPTVTIVRAA